MQEQADRRDKTEEEWARAFAALGEQLGQVEHPGAPEDEELINDQETAVALAELLTLGLIEFRDDDEVKLTNAGIDYAWQVYHNHSPAEMVALTLLLDRIRSVVEEDEE